MKYIIVLFGLIAIFGAVCSSVNQTAAPESTLPTDYCLTGPEENEMGMQVYPIDSKYQNMPHLGQIFTALDCGNPDRALLIHGFVDRKYIAGVTLSWGEDVPPSDFKEALIRLGFTEEKSGTWSNRNPLTFEQIKELHEFFADPAKSGNLKYEDCIICG